MLAVSLGRTELAVADRARALSPARRPSPRWTAAEDDVLREGYGSGLTCAAIAARLPGRSARAVGSRADRLGLPSYGRRWTRSDDWALRELAARGATVVQIARRLTRTGPAIRHRAARLGLRLRDATRRPPRRWSEQEDAVLRQWRQVEPGRLGTLLDRSEGSVRSRLRALGLTPGGSPHYQPPAGPALTPAQERLLLRFSMPVTARHVTLLAERLDRDPTEVVRLLAKARRAAA
jgi:hypothetical protein